MREYRDIDASKMITMHCGGRLAYLYEAQSVDDVRALVSEHQNFYVLGSGTNTIFGDGTIELPVIVLGRDFDYLHEENDIITAGAATNTARLLNYCAENGLSGIEPLAGIPGSLGGAVSMNAGTGDWGIMENVDSLKFIDNEGLQQLEASEIDFGYRYCSLPKRAVVTEISFKLDRTRPETVLNLIDEKMKNRKLQPHGYSSGCIFKNPQGDSAGRLIDAAGLKGTSIGGAFVSETHANFIINDGTASADEIRKLIRAVKNQVREHFGIELREEVKIIV